MALKTGKTHSEGQQGGVTAQTINVAGDFYSGAFPVNLVQEAQESLEIEGRSKPYSVLLCPTSIKQPAVEQVFSEINERLTTGKYEVHISDLDLYENGAYWHLDEADFVSEMEFNSIVIFIGDEKTLCQLSLFTLLIHKKILGHFKLDISIIMVSKSEDPYFVKGCLLFAEDNFSKIYAIEDLEHSGPEELIKYLDRRRTTHYKQSRGRRNKK